MRNVLFWVLVCLPSSMAGGVSRQREVESCTRDEGNAPRGRLDPSDREISHLQQHFAHFVKFGGLVEEVIGAAFAKSFRYSTN